MISEYARHRFLSVDKVLILSMNREVTVGLLGSSKAQSMFRKLIDCVRICYPWCGKNITSTFRMARDETGAASGAGGPILIDLW